MLGPLKWSLYPLHCMLGKDDNNDNNNDNNNNNKNKKKEQERTRKNKNKNNNKNNNKKEQEAQETRTRIKVSILRHLPSQLPPPEQLVPGARSRHTLLAQAQCFLVTQ